MPSSTLFFPPNFLVVVVVAPAFPPGSDIPYILFKSITHDDEQRLHIFRLVAAIVWRREETPLPSRSDTYRSSTLKTRRRRRVLLATNTHNRRTTQSVGLCHGKRDRGRTYCECNKTIRTSQETAKMACRFLYESGTHTGGGGHQRAE